MIENKSVFTAFARQFAEQLSQQYNQPVKPAKAREILSLMVGFKSHNQLISQLPMPFEDWLESEALDRLEQLLKERHGLTLGSDRGRFMQSVIEATNAPEETLNTNDFEVTEAWIFYRITDAPVQTTEGDYHAFILMDAASSYTITQEVLPDGKKCPKTNDVAAILRNGLKESRGFLPKTLIISSEQPNAGHISAAAKALGITVNKVNESALRSRINDLKERVADPEGSESEQPYIQGVDVKPIPLSDDVLSRANVDLSDGTIDDESRDRIGQVVIGDYYTQWLDMSVPALEGMTPREASKTQAGRQLLEDLFDYMKKLPGNAPKPDFEALREALGMSR